MLCTGRPGHDGPVDGPPLTIDGRRQVACLRPRSNETMSSDRLSVPSHETTTAGAGPLAEARFVPQRYEPNYAYPLLVLLHARGGDEQQMVRSMPAMSWRNYVGLSLRGPEVVTRQGRPVGFGWGPGFARRDRERP